MQGTIEIKADGAEIQCHVRIGTTDPFERLMLMEALAEALRMDPFEKKMVGLVLSAGGIEKVMGAEIDKTFVDLSAFEKRPGT